jgi:hypothetical protein
VIAERDPLAEGTALPAGDEPREDDRSRTEAPVDRDERDQQPDLEFETLEPDETPGNVPPPGPEPWRGFDANPRGGARMPRTSDDDDLNPLGSGLADTPLRDEYESIALRAELARRLEDLIASAAEWARDDGSAEAQDIVDMLSEAYERLGEPHEDTEQESDFE